MTFIGQLGNVIGYCRNGKYFLRAAPQQVRQTKATRRAAYRFGIASSKAALIRHAFNDDLDIDSDSSHINRLNAMLMRAQANDMTAIKGFRFNAHAGIDRFFTITPELSAEGILHMPPQTLPSFKGITVLEVKVITARINFGTRAIVHTDAVIMTLNTREPFSGITIPMDITGTGTLVMMMQVRGMNDSLPSNKRQFQAADIIAVQEPLKQQHIKRKKGPRTYRISNHLKCVLSVAQDTHQQHSPVLRE